MTQFKRIFAASFLLFSFASLWAAEEDEPEVSIEMKNSIAQVVISGPPARQLWRSMSEVPEKNFLKQGTRLFCGRQGAEGGDSTRYICVFKSSAKGVAQKVN